MPFLETGRNLKEDTRKNVLFGMIDDSTQPQIEVFVFSSLTGEIRIAKPQLSQTLTAGV